MYSQSLFNNLFNRGLIILHLNLNLNLNLLATYAEEVVVDTVAMEADMEVATLTLKLLPKLLLQLQVMEDIKRQTPERPQRISCIVEYS